jgi:TolB-like protein
MAMAGAGANQEAGMRLPKSDVRIQLERILASEDLCLPDRARSFLRYVVEETLDGRSHFVKAYTIAQAIFQRKNFDANNDPAVRIEAARIRRELERFYLLSHEHEPVLITIPKGGYVPSFMANPEFRKEEVATQPPRGPVRNSGRSINVLVRSFGYRVGAVSVLILCITMMSLLLSRSHPSTEPTNILVDLPAVPTVNVEPFNDVGGAGRTAELSRSIRDEIVVKLVAIRRLTVTIEPTAPKRSDEERYLLQGSARGDGELFRLTARLVRQADGAVLWSDSYDLNVGSGPVVGAEDAIAKQVAFEVARPLKIAPSSFGPSTSSTQTRPAYGGARVSGLANKVSKSPAGNTEAPL